MADETQYYLLEDADGKVTFKEYYEHDYNGPSYYPETWFIPDHRFSKVDAEEVSEIINALVDDRRGRFVLVKRLLKLV